MHQSVCPTIDSQMKTSKGRREKRHSTPSISYPNPVSHQPPIVITRRASGRQRCLTAACVHRETPGRTRRVPQSSAVTQSGCRLAIRRRQWPVHVRTTATPTKNPLSSHSSQRPSTWRHLAEGVRFLRTTPFSAR